MTNRWSPRSKAIAQQHYVRVLRYAKSVGAIGTVHPVDPVEGGNDTYTPPGDSLTEEEVPRVLAAAQNQMHRTLFAVAIGQGTRPEEAVKADWSDVDWEHRVMRFAGFQGRRRKGKNKQATHWVPITPLTYPHLRSWWEACGRPRSGPVFTWRGKPFSSWRHAWKRTVERAGIDPEGRRRIICTYGAGSVGAGPARFMTAALWPDDAELDGTDYAGWVFWLNGAVDMNLSSGAFTVDDADDPGLVGEGYMGTDFYRMDIDMVADATGVMNSSNHTWYLNSYQASPWGSVTIHLQGTYTDTP